MRIVYVADHGSIHTRRWVGFFADRGHDVHVVTCGGADVYDTTPDGEPMTRRYQVHDLGEPRFGKLGYLAKRRAARRIIEGLDPDVVHVHWLTSYGMLALASRVQPLVATAHGDDVLIAPRNPVMRRLVQSVLRRAVLVTVPSETMRSAVHDLVGGAGHPRVEVFQYGVDVRKLQVIGETLREQLVESRRRDPGPVRVISTRAMLQLYRLDALVDAIALLRSDGLNVRCDLVGDGPERQSLERQVAEADMAEHIEFHGHVPPHEVERMVAESDVYVSVAESDGVSLSLLEALALGAVPVLSDIPANRGWVHDGYTGVLVEIDPNAIAGGIQRALALDPQRVARDNVAVVSERADIETNLAACELLIDDIAGVRWDPSPVREADDDNVDAA